MSAKRHHPSPQGVGKALLGGARKRREPVFPISRKEIIQRCRNKPHDMLCAGEALALMDLMQTCHLTIKGMHELSGVARSMIHDMLTMNAVTTNDTQGKLGRPFGMEAIEFHLLGFRLWDTEPMQTTKHAVLTLPSLTGEVSNAINGTSSNCNAENPLNLTVNNPPTQGEVQAIATKLDALIMALRR